MSFFGATFSKNPPRSSSADEDDGVHMRLASSQDLSEIGHLYDIGRMSGAQVRQHIVLVLEDASSDNERLLKTYSELESAGLSMFIPSQYRVREEDLHIVKTRSGHLTAWAIRLPIMALAAALVLLFGTDAFLVVRDGEAVWKHTLNQTGWYLLGPSAVLLASTLLVRAERFASVKDYSREPTLMDVPVFKDRQNHAWKSNWFRRR